MRTFLIGVLFLCGCLGTVPLKTNQTGDGVRLDPEYHWANDAGGPDSPLKSITLRLVNSTRYTANIDIGCRYPNGDLFGERELQLKPRSSKIFVVYGMARTMTSVNSVECIIKSVY